jgi:cobalt/nickel transport protein
MKKLSFSALFLLFLLTSATAHFQVIYTPDSIVEGSEVHFKLVFTHPFNAGHTMDIGRTEDGEVLGFSDFIVIHKEESRSIVGELKQITFQSLENSGVAYEFVLNRDMGFRGGGDWILLGIPHPYYEKSEDIYIQQITKTMINKGDIATDWDARVAEGYPEIIPFVKPYAVWEGGVFRGKVVDGSGSPVALAEIEVEYINYDVDMNANKFTGSPKIKKEGHGAAVILADRQGNFSFIPPKAGYWGFAALGAGGELEHNGKELSQDAVLWIEAKSLEGPAVTEPAAALGADASSTGKATSASNMVYLIIAAVVILAVILFLVLRKKKA